MMHLTRLASRSALAPQQLRNFVQATKPKLGGGHHHETVFDGKPFSKKTVGIGTFLVVGGGTGLIVFAWQFQNWKHGFGMFGTKSEDDEE